MGMLKRPLLFVCTFFIWGIIAASIMHIPFGIWYTALFVAVGAAFLFLRRGFFFLLFLGVSSFLLGASVYVNAKILPSTHIAYQTPLKGHVVTIRGIVTQEPRQGRNKIAFTMQARMLGKDSKKQPVRGKVLVWCFQDVEVRYGQELMVTGKLYRPYSFPAKTNFNYREYLKRMGIYSLLSVGKEGRIIFTGKNYGNPLQKFTYQLKKQMQKRTEEYLSPSAAGILNAMILGMRHEVPQFINHLLQRTGTVHILAVSGLHTGIVAVIVLVLLKILQVPFRLRYVLAVFILIFYCFLSGGRISVVRATIMAVVFLLGRLMNRGYEPLNALSLSALIILWMRPAQVFDAGFQLSFISVLCIILFTQRIMACFPLRLRKSKVGGYVIAAFSVSLAAWLGTAGIIAYYFKLISPVAVIANVIIVPLLFVVVGAGFVFFIVGSLIPCLALPLALSCEFFISLMYRLNSILVRVPGAYFQLQDAHIAIIFLYYGMIVIVFYHSRLKTCLRVFKHKAQVRFG